jgi:hypothetical protein
LDGDQVIGNAALERHEKNLKRLKVLEQEEADASAVPWGFNGYSAIFTLDGGEHDKWQDAKFSEGHTLERTGLCEVCGPEWWDTKGWAEQSIEAAKQNGHGCKYAREDYDRDPLVAYVPAHHGDTAIGKRVKDAELIVQVRNRNPAVLELAKSAMERHSPFLDVLDLPQCQFCSHPEMYESWPCLDYVAAEKVMWSRE